MASITITQLLGGDNIAGSRITINDNFSKLAAAINTQETYLDTSATPGASLNVGSALIKKYTRAITDQIFTCEATGLFGGNLNVGQDFGVTRDLTVGRNATIHGSLTLDGTAGGTVTSTIPISQDAGNINPQFYGTGNCLIVDPQQLTGSGTSRTISASSTFKKVNTIHLNFSTYTGSGAYNCNTVTLPAVGGANVTNGQVITVMITQGPGSGSVKFGIDVANTDDGTYSNIVFNNTAANAADDAILRQSIITLFAGDNGWRVLSAVGSDVLVN
jgi:hypothetical protein